ncbi:hypothetical protein [Oceaniglobus ichthyenteri]|uniref:hypothetical protein n=1 Tax=Oceaniglobus ichthyenteri TaxID=2136177 RepID=UPI000D372564|nr:hypothetical protein [Oceaniglobus ichthyenteri]
MKSAFILVFALAAAPVLADPAIVKEVKAQTANDTWTFSVTLSHGDTGWDDYADGWRVEAANGTVLGERPLAHPHVDEQPFTRSQSGIAIPSGTARVFIRTRTNTEGWADTTTPFTLP